MPRILLILEYDGTPYGGWQRQRTGPSVQATLEAALQLVTGAAVTDLRLSVAGRTDVGVHARGQRATFDTTQTREARRFAPALNHVLPRSIRVHLATSVADDFDVRRAARAKWYRYTAYTGLHASALWQHRAWHVRKRFDALIATQAAAALLGEHDFEAFRSLHCDAAHARRCLYSARVTTEITPPIGTFIYIDLVGNAFCRHMCRILAGTLIDIGCGERSATATADALRNRQRATAGQTAPAWGLTLMDIDYAADGRWPDGWPIGGMGPMPR